MVTIETYLIIDTLFFSFVLLIGFAIGYGTRMIMKRVFKRRYGWIKIKIGEGQYAKFDAKVKTLSDDKGNTYHVLFPQRDIEINTRYAKEKGKLSDDNAIISKTKYVYAQGVEGDEYFAVVDRDGYFHDPDKPNQTFHTPTAYRLLFSKFVQLLSASNLIRSIVLIFIVTIIIVAVIGIVEYYQMSQLQNQLKVQGDEITQLQSQLQNVTAYLHKVLGG
jgi:cell division protein FtsL